MDSLESLHRSIVPHGNTLPNGSNSILAYCQKPIKRRTSIIHFIHHHHPHHHHHNESSCYKYLLAITYLTVIFCATITNSYLTEEASGHDSYDNRNQLAGDLGMYKITWKGPIGEDYVKEMFDRLGYEKDSPGKKGLFQIATMDNEQYTCLDPPSNKKDALNFDSSARNSTSEKDKSPIQLLEPLLKGNYCSYKFDLFWIYELCHGKFLRQYHEENAKYKAKVTQEYYLGKMNEDQIKLQAEQYERDIAEMDRLGQQRPTILVNGVHKPYVMFNMTGGTKCDMTKLNRVSRIAYVCNEEPSLELYSVTEISICEYEAIVLSPHLCQHKDFKIDTATQHEIMCYSLSNSPRQPKRIKDFHNEDDEDRPLYEKLAQKRKGIAYLQGRTLIIDADLLLS